jgi:hypothetical protein
MLILSYRSGCGMHFVRNLWEKQIWEKLTIWSIDGGYVTFLCYVDLLLEGIEAESTYLLIAAMFCLSAITGLSVGRLSLARCTLSAPIRNILGVQSLVYRPFCSQESKEANMSFRDRRK